MGKEVELQLSNGITSRSHERVHLDNRRHKLTLCGKLLFTCNSLRIPEYKYTSDVVGETLKGGRESTQILIFLKHLYELGVVVMVSIK